MNLVHRLGCAALVLGCAWSHAAEEPAPADAGAAASAPAAAQAPVKFEAALGAVVSYEPEYQGGSRSHFKLTPAFFIRYGRISLSQASGFVTRRYDDLPRGLGLEMVRDERAHVSLALRLDRGRRSSVSSALAGVSDVRTTVRARISASYNLDPHWKVAGGVGIDLLGRGGGTTADVGISRDTRLTPRLTWGVGTSLSGADGRYMRSYYGINAAESAASGYPVYTPGAGIKGMSVGTAWRMEIGEDWSAFVGVSAGRLLGSAVDSPLTTRRNQWSVSSGIARRF